MSQNTVINQTFNELDASVKGLAKNVRREKRREWRFIHTVDLFIALFVGVLDIGVVLGVFLAPIPAYTKILVTAPIIALSLLSVSLWAFNRDGGESHRRRRREQWAELTSAG